MSKEVFKIGFKPPFSFPKKIIFDEQEEGFIMEVRDTLETYSGKVSNFYVDDGDLIVEWIASKPNRGPLFNWAKIGHVVSEKMED